MPLTKRGAKIKKKMEENYGKKKGDQVFYAMENAGKLKGVVEKKGGKKKGASKKSFHGYHSIKGSK